MKKYEGYRLYLTHKETSGLAAPPDVMDWEELIR